MSPLAYADDLTVFSSIVPDIRADYAKQWRFKFGISKTKCMAQLNGNRVQNLALVQMKSGD